MPDTNWFRLALQLLDLLIGKLHIGIGSVDTIPRHRFIVVIEDVIEYDEVLYRLRIFERVLLRYAVALSDVLPDTDDVDALAELRDSVIGGGENLIEHLVAGLVETLSHDSKRVSLIVLLQVSDVLEEQYFRLVVLCDTKNVVEERPASIIEPALLTAYGERLAWEAATNDVHMRDVLGFCLRDVIFRVVMEVALVRLTCVFVNLAAPYAFRPKLLKCAAESADTCE